MKRLALAFTCALLFFVSLSTVVLGGPTLSPTNTPTSTTTPRVSPTTSVTPTPSGTSGLVADRQRYTTCLKTTWCDSSTDKTGLCADVNKPIQKSHRMHFATDSKLSGDLFFMECISIKAGGEACYPLPMDTNGQIVNGDNSSVSWGTPEDKQLFRNAFLSACKAQFKKNSDNKYSEAVINFCNGLVTPFDNQAKAGTDDFTFYTFQGLYVKNGTELTRAIGPLKNIPASGYEWASYTEGSRTRYIVGVSFSDPSPGISPASSSGNSNKIDQLGFLSVPENCKTTASWDPYGVAFYSGEGAGYLEPISESKIKLYESDNKSLTGSYKPYEIVIGTDYFNNPQDLSITNGGFSFVVPANFYRFVVSKAGNNFPATIPPADRLSGDLIADANALAKYPSGQVKVKITDEKGVEKVHTLYKNVLQSTSTDYWPAFEEKPGQLLEVNVPIDSIAPPESTYTYQQIINPVSGLESYDGLTNKPFAKIVLQARLYTDTEGLNPIVKSKWVRADQDGKFKMVVDPKKDYSIGEVFAGFVVERADLRNAVITSNTIDKVNKFIASLAGRIVKLLDIATPNVYAQTQTKLPPMRLGYVEGYAYGADGAVLKNTTVIIMDTMLLLQYSSVKTDETGYFVIRPQDLPPRGYSLMYVQSEAPYKTVGTATLEQFVKANLPYIQQNKINLAVPALSQNANTFTQTHPELFTSIAITPGVTGQPSVSGAPSGTAISGTQINPSGSQLINPNPTIQQVTQEPVGPEMKPFSPALLIYVALLLFLVVGASLLIVYYMKRRQEPHLYE